MKYTILINQFAAVKSGLDLDLIDLSIFDFIKDFANSQSCVKIQTPEGIYFWVSHKLIIDSMPLLKIKTAQGIIKRIENLIKAELLIKHPNCEFYSKTLYSFGKNYDLLTFNKTSFSDSEPKLNPLNESLAPPQQKFNAPLNESLGNNTIIDNTINNNSIVPPVNEFTDDTQKTLFPENDLDKKQKDEEERKKVAQKKESAERKTLFKNSDVHKLVNFENPEGADYSEFEKLYNTPEFNPVDLVYYFHVVCDWSDTKNMKRTKAGWIATVRNFIRGDAEKNKVRLKPEFQVSKAKIDVAGAMEFLNDFD